MADIERDIVLRVKSETDQAQGQFKNLKQELRSIENELNKMAAAGQTGTAAFNKLQQRAGEVKDQIGDTKNAIKALSSDTFKLDAFAQGAQGIAGGFAAAQGAMALFGSENKAVEEAIKKTQGAMALLQGVTAITNILQKDSAFSLAFLGKAQKENAVATEVGTKATKGFSKALAATGIGLLVVALGLLIANFEDVKKVVMNLLKPFDGIIAKVRDFLSTISFGLIDNAATAKTKENADKVVEAFNKTKDAMKEAEKTIERRIELAKAEGKSAKEIYNLEKQLADLRIKNLKTEQTALQTKVKAGNATDDEKKRIKELTTEIADANNKRLVLDANYKKAVEEANKKAKEKAESDAKKAKEELEKLREFEAKYEEDRAKEKKEKEEKSYDDSIKANDAYYAHLIATAQLNDQETETLEIQKLEKQIEIEKKFGNDTTALADEVALKKKGIKDKEVEAKKELTDKELQMDIDAQKTSLTLALESETLKINKKKELAKQAYLDGIISQKEYNEAINKLEVSAAAKRAEIFKFAMEQTQKAFSAVAAFRENQMNQELQMAKGNEKEQEAIRKRYFEQNKKVQIAEAIIQTIAGVQGVFTSTSKSPITAAFPAAPYIAAASALASGLANVQKIRQTQFQGSASPSSSGSNGPAINSQPSQNSQNTPGINSTMLNLDAQGNLRQGPTRTYVVESEISDKQRRSRQLSQTAILGK
jgi:hypothetical protein